MFPKSLKSSEIYEVLEIVKIFVCLAEKKLNSSYENAEKTLTKSWPNIKQLKNPYEQGGAKPVRNDGKSYEVCAKRLETVQKSFRNTDWVKSPYGKLNRNSQEIRMKFWKAKKIITKKTAKIVKKSVQKYKMKNTREICQKWKIVESVQN